MEKEREVDKLISFFDLKIGEMTCSPESISTRVMLIYDKNENIKEFTVLNKKILQETKIKISSWLKENMEVHDIMKNLSMPEIHIDSI